MRLNNASTWHPKGTSDLDYIIAVARQMGICCEQMHRLMYGLSE